MNSNLIQDNRFVALKCTPKCLQAINNRTELTGRERQLCILLAYNDDVCKKAYQQLAVKVDIGKLIDEGYLTFENDLLAENYFITDDDMTEKKLSNSDIISEFAYTHKTLNNATTDSITTDDDLDNIIDINFSELLSESDTIALLDTASIIDTKNISNTKNVSDFMISPALQFVSGNSTI